MKKQLFLILFIFLIINVSSCKTPALNYSKTDKNIESTVVNNSNTDEIEKLSEAEAVQALLNYIYGKNGYEYFKSAVIKYLKFPELADGDPMLTYEFVILPRDDEMRIVRRIACRGLLKNKSYYILDNYFSYYDYDDDNNKVFSHSTYDSAYAINSVTGEVICQRKEDENGIWVYNESFPQ